MFNPLISVVIPAYNAAGFINRTLDSLKTQEFRLFETIIVNDGSSDNTQIIIDEYMRLNPDLNIKLVSQQNKGIAEARNRGIREAKAELIAFLDHDDTWYPQKLSRCYEFMQQHSEIDLVCHNEIMRDHTQRIIRTLTYGPYINGMFRKLLFKGNCLSTSAIVVRKQALWNVGLFRGNSHYLEDYDLWLKLSKAHRFSFLPEVLGEYLLHDTNISRDLLWHQFSSINVVKRNFWEFKDKKIADYFFFILRILRLYISIGKNFLLKGLTL